MRLITLYIILITPCLLYAGTIKGKVVSNNDTPIPYAYVSIDALNKTTVTDARGNYQFLEIPQGDHNLTVSSLGYQTQTTTITIINTETKVYNFKLISAYRELDEVNITVDSEERVLEKSDKAIQVIDTKKAKEQTADLGEVIAASEGVSVRRSGGLGSATRFSLNGLTDNQVRFFIDGMPLQYSPYSVGIANVPVNLIERAEIYKGVVPIAFGADALGGAVNIVTTDYKPGIQQQLSYQTGSFGTHRGTYDLKYQNQSSGLIVGFSGFYDFSKNNYLVHVEHPNEKGKLEEVTVPKFHDDYEAYNGQLTLGVADKKWTDKATVKIYNTSTYDEVQHNNVMSGVPYGDIVYTTDIAGVILDYELEDSLDFKTDIKAGYNYEERQFLDTGACVYNWMGECFLRRNNPGELSGWGGASNQFTWINSAFIRINQSYVFNERHKLNWNLSPSYEYRTGDERLVGTYDPFTSKSTLLTWVNGASYNYKNSKESFKNTFFIKTYYQSIDAEEPAVGWGDFNTESRKTSYLGWGNSIKLNLSEQLFIKPSYEWATRLPSPNEVFGDGSFTGNNFDIKPERSHNINLGAYWVSKNNIVNFGINSFARLIDNYIILIPTNDRSGIYQNVFEARSLGLEANTKVQLLDKKLSITANTTYMDFRNNSNQGTFGSFYGDRIPNQPYFFVNANSSYIINLPKRDNQRLTVFANTRYIKDFYLSWESLGHKDFKFTIPYQLTANAGITYELLIVKKPLTATAEVRNLTNAQVFDFFGVQRPGRAFYIKLTKTL